MSENLTPGTLPRNVLDSMLVYVLDMGYCDFHGATLQAGLAGLCPINIRILVRGGALLLYQLRYGRAV